MGQNPDEIKSIERVCENLNKWQKGDIPQDFKELGRHSQLIMLVQPLINDVVVDLLAQKMAHEGRLVRDKFEELLNQAKLVDDLREKASEDALFEDSTLLRLAWEFILILRRIAPAKRCRIWTLVKRIPRWICGLFITVFVALIAAIVIDIFADLGWLESIKAFICNILWPE